MFSNVFSLYLDKHLKWIKKENIYQVVVVVGHQVAVQAVGVVVVQ